MNFSSLPKPMICAHRGSSAHAPENTLAAFSLALEQHADAVELDAKLTVDGEIIVIHDQTVDRTTGAHGRVRDLTLAQIKALDAGSWKGPQFSGEPIPTLDEVFQTVGGKCFINVELTNYATPNDALVDRVIELIHRHKLEESVFFSSFHPVNLLKAARLAPETPSGILSTPGGSGWIARSFVGRWFAPWAVHPYYADIDAQYVERQHSIGRLVNVWTVDAPEDIRKMIEFGVDGIITDDPVLARNILDKQL